MRLDTKNNVVHLMIRTQNELDLIEANHIPQQLDIVVAFNYSMS